ncbi:PP2C family protein-serine/threonine phosphatase [Actinomadura rudentiformis]|uniref:SpoIIE family protein phosphatase n=1 Tax=Actinomadura rudentiformis TaxID=359158 RepID=A0A6H9YS62_9ACTN|nr:SpoIIE family protein phosphatase [Actinomadura rudentiformis]KAB2350836.1 SpoIIE family protein phosphatase [Actinomadura rudentiformis]
MRSEDTDREADEPIWALAPYPALAADGDGVISQINDAARVLFGTAELGVPLADAVPDWLHQAHRQIMRGSDAASATPVRGPIGERTFEAHPTRWTDKGVPNTVWWLVDSTDRQSASDALRIERERAAFLTEVSNDLASLDVGLCLNATVRLAARHLADLALVVAPGTGRGYSAVFCGPDGHVVNQDLDIDPGEVPGLAEALRGFPSAAAHWIDPATVPERFFRGLLDTPGSMMVATLPGAGAPAGAMVLVRRADRAAYTESEEAFARMVAIRAGAAVSAARLYAEQTSITEILMRELLPPRARDLDGVELAARYRPSGSGEQVGGDFYDLYPAGSGDRESLVVLGDVCGKGLQAAVLTGKIRNALQVLLPLADDHHHVLSRLNQMMLLNGDPTKFVTLVLASVRRHGERVRVRLTSAGHPAPLIIRADGTVEEVPTVGTLIGVMEQLSTDTVTVELAPGETCLLHTDGVTEARGGPNGEMFGEDRLHEELARCGGMTPDALVEHVQMLASEWVGDGHHDDMAVIAITPPQGH